LAEKIISLQNAEQVSELCGNYDKNLHVLKKEYDVEIVIRDLEVKILGDEDKTKSCKEAIENILSLMNSGKNIDELNVRYAVSMEEDGASSELKELGNDCICITQKGKPVYPKTVGQKKYINTISKNTITLGIGPAGTGKTYLAVAME